MSEDGEVLSFNESVHSDFIVLFTAMFPKKEDEEMEAATRTLQDFLFDVFITSIQKVISVLDLKIVESNGDEKRIVTEALYPGDVSKLAPSNPKDMAMFLNLVDFIRTLFPKIRTKRLNNWFEDLVAAWIESSKGHPLISGYYKLIATLFKATAKKPFPKLFKGDATYLKSYLSIVQKRLEFLLDDLLAACLELIFSAPKELLEAKTLVYPYKMAFKHGVIFPQHALYALEMVDFWFKNRHEYRSQLEQIAPSFGAFLKMMSELNPSSTEEQGKSTKKSTSRMFSLRKLASQRKVAIEVALSFLLSSIYVLGEHERRRVPDSKGANESL